MLSAGGLLLRKLCGELSCPEYYMCNHHDLHCYPCKSYCDETSNNYDVHVCERQCQDYIHDFIFRYTREKYVQEMEQELDNFRFLIIVMGVLTVFALVFMILAIVFVLSLDRRLKMITNGGRQRPYLNSAVSAQFLRKKDLGTTIVNEKVAGQIPLAASSSSRQQPHGEGDNNGVYPSIGLPYEDGTIDFRGYDNLAVSWSKH